METVRIAKYMRLSREDKEAEESQSISNQRGIIDSYLNSVPVFSNAKIEEYIDDGFSGMTMDRPSLRELLKKVQAGVVDVIIVKDFSRFARNYIDQGQYLEVVFPSVGVRFISVNDYYDSIEMSKLSEKFHIAIPGIMNHLYSTDLSIKVKTAKQSLIKGGKMCSSRVPYGYTKDREGKKPYIIEDETAKVVRYIFAMAAEGKKVTAIAKELNNQNILSPGAYKERQGLGRYSNDRSKSNIWEYSAIRNILNDERYIGTLVLGKSERKIPGNPNGSRLPKEKWLRFPEAFEPIIDKDIFYQVQDMKKEGTIKRKKEKNLPILYKKVKCKNCGRFMKYKDVSYYCRTPLLMDGMNCFVGYVKEEIIIDAVFSVLKTHAQIAENYQDFVCLYQKNITNSNKDIPNCIARLHRQCKELVIKKGKLYEEYKQGKHTKENYITQKEQIQKQYDVLEKDKEMLIEEQKEKNSQENQSMSTFSHFTKKGHLTSKMANALIDMVYVEDRKHIKVILKYEDDCMQALL